jgi:hypothetical protein
VSRSVRKPRSAYRCGTVQQSEERTDWPFSPVTDILVIRSPRVRNAWHYTSMYTVCGRNLSDMIRNRASVSFWQCAVLKQDPLTRISSATVKGCHVTWNSVSYVRIVLRWPQRDSRTLPGKIIRDEADCEREFKRLCD